jgi:hypothetical protein
VVVWSVEKKKIEKDKNEDFHSTWETNALGRGMKPIEIFLQEKAYMLS